MGRLASVARRRGISLRGDAVGRISVAPSGTATGTVPDCPATLRLSGLGYMRLRVAVDTVFGLQLSRPDKAFITCNFSEICAPG
ncbi:hypothetical protein B6I99_18800 [Klebsiella quasipneumoniae]|nr:hypothetical protein B6I99_18800 [Klebsiella quasipneumoniae]